MVCSRICFRGWNQRHDSVGYLIRVAIQDGIVGVGEFRIAGIDDQNIVFAPMVGGHAVDFVQGFAVQFSVNENEPSPCGYLLEHQQLAEHGFPNPGLPHDGDMANHVVMARVQRLASVHEIAQQGSVFFLRWSRTNPEFAIENTTGVMAQRIDNSGCENCSACHGHG